MAKPFRGRISIDIRDSKPDWTPYLQATAPDGAPSILYLVWDDVGFGALESFGGLIETPNMTRIANRGLRFTNWHTTALCSPTRACLLTGRNHTSNGMACITEVSTGFPGSNGHVPGACATLAEILVGRGYNTYCVGKWHLTPADELSIASAKNNWPLGRGFERFYGYLGAETNQWYPDLVYDNHPVEQPRDPSQGYHLSKDLVDKAVEFVRDAKMVSPEKPFLLYLAPGAGHAPHHAPKDWIKKYQGKFDMGYEKYRQLVLERQRQMRIVSENTELPPVNPLGTPADTRSPGGVPFPELDYTRPWESLSADEKKLFCRMAEVYAGFISYTDHQIGRLLDHLEESGQLDNTLVVVVSDNGASGEGGPNGSVNENKLCNGIADDIRDNLKFLDELGSPATYNHYPNGWAMGFNTPFKMWKRWSYNGGVADPCIISWPMGIQARGELRPQYHHAIDIVPTLLECLGLELPDSIKGHTQKPIEGVSMRYAFHDADAPTKKDTQFYSMLGTRALWRRGWKAVSTHPPLSGWGHFEKDTWELYNTDEDPSETHDLAAANPDLLNQLIQLWHVEAGRYDALPLDDRMALDLMMDDRPSSMSRPRKHYVYYPTDAEVPEEDAVNVRNRSYTIAAEVEIPDGGAEGVLFAHGSHFGGHSLYVKEGRLSYVYNWLGIDEQRVSSNGKQMPTGKSTVAAVFKKENEEPKGVARGTLSLYINGQKVGESKIKTQPGKFSIAGEGLAVGRDTGDPVTSDYPGSRPWSFTGKVKRVLVDVSGEPYLDLEREIQAAFARD